MRGVGAHDVSWAVVTQSSRILSANAAHLRNVFGQQPLAIDSALPSSHGIARTGPCIPALDGREN